MHKRLTTNAKQVIQHLKTATNQTDLRKIDAFFLLRSIGNCKGCLGKSLLETFNVKLKSHSPQSKNQTSVHHAITKAAKIAYSVKSSYIGTEHLVQGVLSMPEYSHLALREKLESRDPQIKIFGINSQNQKGQQPSSDYFGEISSMIEQHFNPLGTTQKQKKQSYLSNFCTNLNQTTSLHHTIIGRQNELDRISYVLGRKMKNNPVLIGDPGVGKTAIVEGLAQKINKGKAPYFLSDKKIMSLDLGLLIAGTTFRGEFESRLKDVVNEIKNSNDIILFIDEIHNLVGAGNAIGGMDAANLLKPVLSRGEVQVIGATTIDEYQKHIEKDAALERRFQPIIVSEPSVDETRQILKGIKPFYEEFHNVSISDESCVASAQLAKRYMTDRFLPDSAIDLIDETSARLRSELSNKKLYRKVKLAKQKRDRIIEDKEQLVLNDHYEEAIRVRQEEKKISTTLKRLKGQLRVFEKKNPITIEAKDIRATLSETSSIPEQLLHQQDKQIVKNVNKTLSKGLIGQNHVNKRVSDTILRQVSGISSPNRPLGSFLFIGPTGVGKTHAAKLLAQSISPKSNEALIQINMSEFMERHTTSRLLGAPAGYVGYDDSNELTDKIRRKPYSVVLFDEIEKAEPSILNILLQVFEEGEVSDSKGRAVNFRNTIVVLTSNIGTNDLDKLSDLGFETNSTLSEKEKVEQSIMTELDDLLPQEFLNRLDDIFIFNHLSKKDIKSIVALELEKINMRLKQKKIDFSFNSDLINFLANHSHNPRQGARMVRKTIQDLVEPPIATKLLSKQKNKKIHLSLKNKKVIVQK